MKMAGAIIVCTLAALTAGNSVPQSTAPTDIAQADTGDLAVVLARPVRIIKSLGVDPDSPSDVRVLLLLEKVEVLEGEFKPSEFRAVMTVHQPAYVFGSREYVMVLRREGKEYRVLRGTDADVRYCFSKSWLAETKADRIITAHEEDQGPDTDMRCWHQGVSLLK